MSKNVDNLIVPPPSRNPMMDGAIAKLPIVTLKRDVVIHHASPMSVPETGVVLISQEAAKRSSEKVRTTTATKNRIRVEVSGTTAGTVPLPGQRDSKAAVPIPVRTVSTKRFRDSPCLSIVSVAQAGNAASMPVPIGTLNATLLRCRGGSGRRLYAVQATIDRTTDVAVPTAVIWTG